jgi:hypothetical protein
VVAKLNLSPCLAREGLMDAVGNENSYLDPSVVYKLPKTQNYP